MRLFLENRQKKTAKKGPAVQNYFTCSSNQLFLLKTVLLQPLTMLTCLSRNFTCLRGNFISPLLFTVTMLTCQEEIQSTWKFAGFDHIFPVHVRLEKGWLSLDRKKLYGPTDKLRQNSLLDV